MKRRTEQRPTPRWHRINWAAALVGVATLAVGSAACSSTSSSGAPAAASKANSGAEPVIGVSFYSHSIPLYVGMATGMNKEAAAEHVRLEFQYAGDSASTQTAQIEDFVTEHVSAILCSPVSPQALIPAYQQADHAGIPIISVGNEVPRRYQTTYVGDNQVQLGQEMMQWVVQKIGGSGPILELTGPPTISFVHDMSQGWAEVLAKYPKVEVVSDLAGPLSETGGLTNATNALTAHPNVKAVVTDADEVALGALEAMSNLHISPKTVFVTGQDGDPPNLASIRSGDGQAYTQSLEPIHWGQLAVKTAVQVLHGQHLGPIVEAPTQVVTRSNVGKLSTKALQ